ncbi:outer membrane beta-barrel protein [Marinimicrobium sp. ARAG 43.8]|uniref:outer membrane beta-barrel protein n=1 Tax=Marinimicrobium sp. ARAG 43.8 TaxID=3418719 RepID=UPI003CF0AE39
MKLSKVLGKTNCLITMTMVMAPMAIQAESLSYSYADLGYQTMTGDGSFDGFLVGGSYQINEQFYVAGSYDELEDEGLSQNVLSVRGGMRFALNDTIDLYGEAGVARAEVEVSYYDEWSDQSFNSSASETGVQIEGGGRMRIAEPLEAGAYLRHIKVGDTSETFLGLQGTYYFSDRFGAHANVSRLFDASEFLLQAGVRLNF